MALLINQIINNIDLECLKFIKKIREGPVYISVYCVLRK